ncbi:hypothetical protein B0T17DRAFT_629823 [Bombardia bombarda]|uniref:Polyketide synthase n=1 Tax=Bombardia bombarda TaxID=252184 RepID=A0AA39W3Z1_9PEZI|nr:hypothetical protein B0T17DRAFT_629823 [Bombardia bombarda]
MAYKMPSSEPMAIVGIGCRFPGRVTSPSELWQLLKDPKNLSRHIPAERFNIDAFYHPDGEYHGTTNSPKAYFLDQDHRVFDAGFFNITPKEAEAIDPQHRMLLEVVYEALESAGYTLQQYAGKNVGVFTGMMTADYDGLSQRDDLFSSQYFATGNARSIAANRLSYFYNFRGPSMTIDTACSSSLVALHQAVLSLRSGDCEMACVTGVNLIITPDQFLAESNLHMLSPTGHCRMWDAKADGYARGEGIAAVFIKPLSKALADQDHIEAIIRETGVNSDGRSKGITMPNWEAQSALIQETYRRSGLDSKSAGDRCQYFEAHGTGTSAGDPNEARAIDDAFFHIHGRKEHHHEASDRAVTSTMATQKLLVGSIKTVIGHTEGAAGLAGLLKVVLAMNHNIVPPNLHLDQLAPSVEQHCTDLSIPTHTTPWPHVPDGQPKRASVNSFGFGGTNAHVIVEQYEPKVHDIVAEHFQPNVHLPKECPQMIEHECCSPKGQVILPLLLSAQSYTSLIALARKYLQFVRDHTIIPREELAWGSYAHRTPFEFRVALSGKSVGDLMAKLDQFVVSATKLPTSSIAFRVKHDERPKILGIFTGQGAQWATMSRGLLQSNRTYAQTIRRLDQILQNCPHPPAWSLENEIMVEESISRVQKAAIAQPLCTAVQLALVDLLYSLGIGFHTVVGHSSGEIGAAYAAGRLSLRDAMLISYYRGMFTHLACSANGDKGGMLAAGLTREEAAEWCGHREYSNAVYFAASNAPNLVTLSGDLEAVKKMQQTLVAKHTFAHRLPVDTAYHSPHMELPATKYQAALADCGITPSARSTHETMWVSSVYGHGEPDVAELQSTYWRDNMLKPVLFCEAVETALSDFGPFDCLVEVGPHTTLKSSVEQIMQKKIGTALPYSGLLVRGMDDRVAFSDFLGWMWMQFASSSPQIHRFVLGSVQPDLIGSHLKNMPTYPWDHSHVYWRQSRISRQHHFKTDPPHELLGVRTCDDNQYELRWRNILHLDKIPWAEHHSFQGHSLVPASAYCIMALDAARALSGGRPASMVELMDLKFHNGIILEPDSHGVEVMFSLKVAEAFREKEDPSTMEASFILTSGGPHGSDPMKLNFSGTLRIVFGTPHRFMLPSRPLERPETLHASASGFYKMMAGTGLTYSGPFKGLKDVHRRYNFASGTVDKMHVDDDTMLSISPATMDSCLQTAFLTISSPGDEVLWTSFLPKSIDRIRFNMAICNVVKTCKEELVVDAYLTREKPFTRESAASYTADIHVFSEDEFMEMQIEGLTVESFSPARPDQDRLLYLTTVLLPDPEDEIVQASATDLHPPSPMLTESCDRVASFYISKAFAVNRICQSSQRAIFPAGCRSEWEVATNSWPTETAQTLDAFVHKSPYFSTLDFVRRIGQNLPDVLMGMLPTIVEEAHQLVGFQNHVSRVVGQISHKYSRMKILGLTDPDLGLTPHVLEGLDNMFATFRVGAEAEKNLTSCILTTEYLQRKVTVSRVDLDVEDPKLSADSGYDLVIFTTSLIENQKSRSVFNKIRRMMRPGGFLILVHDARSPLKDRLRRCASSLESEDTIPTTPKWVDLLDECGFGHSMRNSEQNYLPGFSLIVRQAESRTKMMYRRPLAHLAECRMTGRVLVVGGGSLGISLIAKNVCQTLLDHQCHNITAVETLDHIDPSKFLSFSAVILLSEIFEPILATMTHSRMDALRALVRPDVAILWVTHNAMTQNSDHASSFGFARTLIAETPGLHLQVLDLDTLATGPAVDAISKAFARLTLHHLDHDVKDENALCLHEHEVHFAKGSRYVPRILPWKEGNNRVNAHRRVVSNPVNTLKKSVEIVPTRSKHIATQYEAEVSSFSLRDKSTICVEYSTVDVVNLGLGNSPHVCVGRNHSTGQMLATLSKTNASFVAPHHTCISNIPHGHTDLPLFLALLSRYLTALTVAHVVQGKNVLLVDPDELFEQCAKDVLVKRGIFFRVCTTDEKRCSLIPSTTFIHSNSTHRDVQALYRHDDSCVVDMLPDNSEISKILAESAPANCHYYSRSSLLTPEQHDASDLPLFVDVCEHPQRLESVWKEAVGLALSKSKGSNWNFRPELTTVPDLLQAQKSPYPFMIVDWKAERSISRIIKPTFERKLLRADRTYLLVGLTRDFGQSLSTFLVNQGARHIILASRSPPEAHTAWQEELIAQGVNIKFEKMDVTRKDQVLGLKSRLAESWPPIGGVANGAMVLEDRVFSEMSVDTLHRVMRPKTVGSKNLDIVFSSSDMDFFILVSSFAAMGGHPGQSNYAAGNMYMNGLAMARRKRGLAASVLNIGVIYGLGFLHREKSELYGGLERDGYPPISERDIHHMFMEAIYTGAPGPGQISDIITGLRRWPVHDPSLAWHYDPRFSHYWYEEDTTESSGVGCRKLSVKDRIGAVSTREELLGIVEPVVIDRLERQLQLGKDTLTCQTNISSLGIDSLVAVEMRSWMWKNIGHDVAVMKILNAQTISKLCQDIVVGIIAARETEAKAKPASNVPDGKPTTGQKPPAVPKIGISGSVTSIGTGHDGATTPTSDGTTPSLVFDLSEEVPLELINE